MGDWAEGLQRHSASSLKPVLSSTKGDSYNSRFDRGIGPEEPPADLDLVGAHSWAIGRKVCTPPRIGPEACPELDEGGLLQQPLRQAHRP